MKIEICANSYQSAVNAEKAGADRIELCVELAVGGITPSHGLIEKVVQKLSIPVFVLIRPRSGNFTYTSDEFDVMKKDIEFCKSIGCKGIVSGVLKNDNTIDSIRTQELITLSKPLSFTFHRAFDWVPEPLESLKQLIAIGVERILTSGQEASAIEGIELLKNALQLSKPNLIIMPGSGINVENVLTFKEAGFEEIHFSATSLEQVMQHPKVTMNSIRFFDETVVATSDYDKMIRIKNLL
ncbi:copper homeostasis protein CutC [uncultured Aquimarina sp.]|uniref:copper homeostasis protein CutC n=1 Tax=uncultured Aquimarina sp. TaxID=575652 RepID=UPI0026262AD8|nr:copper homeostasis protein CutC [uncultured Aquimarina sp.]